MGHLCKHCSKTFSTAWNLKYHEKTIHSINEHENVYICNNCSRNFSHKTSLRRHVLNCKQHKVLLKRKSKIISCILCGEADIPKHEMPQHYSSNHGLDMSIKKLHFNSFVEFEHWKDGLETDTVSKFIRYYKGNFKNRIEYGYRCHRDGFFTSGGKNLRHMKIVGSNKINGHCPAKIYVRKMFKTDEVTVDFLPTHVGHRNDDIGRIPLKKSQRTTLAEKIQQKIPFDEILHSIKDTVSENNLERIHLLKRKDLYNIVRDYNINDSIRHANDAVSLESWIDQSKQGSDIVRFYKKQGEFKETCDYTFEENDFLLILMNDAQLDILKKYGNDCICIDSTHGLTSYDFELTTVMVLDDLRQGFPCLLAFSNRSDTQIFKIIFDVLKTHLDEETLSPNVFMSDMANTFYNVWCDIMGPVKMRLYCTWLMNRAWKKNVLAKVEDSKQQDTLFKILGKLLEEPDEAVFEEMLRVSLKAFDSNDNWKNFGVYFRENYVENRTAWAYCYRQHECPNTINMHFERMHRTLENIYLKSKSVKRLHKTINDIMKVVRNKLNERLMQKENESKKLSDLRRRHKRANQICIDRGIDDRLILTNEDGSWTVLSSQANESYKVEVLNPDCTCALKCQDCNACLHSYTCTCLDSAVKWNMCTHVHITCMFLKTKYIDVAVNDSTQQIIGDIDDDHSYIIDEDPRTYEQQIVLNHLSSTNSQTYVDIEAKKAKLLEIFVSDLNFASTAEDLDVIENALLPIRPTLEAVRSNINFSDIHIHSQIYKND